jgi:hypothetical protein
VTLFAARAPNGLKHQAESRFSASVSRQGARARETYSTYLHRRATQGREANPILRAGHPSCQALRQRHHDASKGFDTQAQESHSPLDDRSGFLAWLGHHIVTTYCGQRIRQTYDVGQTEWARFVVLVAQPDPINDRIRQRPGSRDGEPDRPIARLIMPSHLDGMIQRSTRLPRSLPSASSNISATTGRPMSCSNPAR